MADRPEAMHWPTWRSKLLPVTFLWLSWSRPWLHLSIGGNWYFGNWWALHLGPWLWFGGSGTYK